MEFHQRATEALGRVEDRHKDEAARARKSIRAAQDQLTKITPELCQEFVRLRRADRATRKSCEGLMASLDGARGLRHAGAWCVICGC